MKNNLLFALLLLLCGIGYSQHFSYTWTATNSPPSAYRFDDIYFLSTDTGFAVHYARDTTSGYVARTYDGGATWHKVWDSTGNAFRDICFATSQHGWIGTLQAGHNSSDTTILFETTDGGDSWFTTPNLPGPRPAGICGMYRVTDSIVVAVGRYPGPSGFYKTTDQGSHWSYVALDSLVGGLVDVYFVDADTGFAVGTSGHFFYDHGRVLATVDGGATWRVAHTSAHAREICWKISFPTRQVGYVSLEAFGNVGSHYLLKTIDGGLTWQDIDISTGGGPIDVFDVQGMGFVNDSVGWLGGDSITFFTEDGGQTWVQQHWGQALNRFRFLGDSVAYAAGQKVYRMSRTLMGMKDALEMDQGSIANVPNPFTIGTTIPFSLERAGHVLLEILDGTGNRLQTLADAPYPPGKHAIYWDAQGLPKGIYYYRLQVGEQSIAGKMVVHR